MPQILQREIKGKAERTLTVERASINPDARTVELALSSETPYERWYGIEILGHGPGEVDMSRITNGAALLFGHNTGDQIGVVESARLDPDRVLRVIVRFSRSARAEEIFQDVIDGIRSKVSVGYQTSDYVMTKGIDGTPDTYRFTGWQPMEASIVSVPADDTVGVGRALEAEEPPPTPQSPVAIDRTVKESPMTPEEIAAAQKAAEDLKKTTSDQMRAERIEALQLQAIASHLGLGKEASEILASDKPLAEARVQIMGLVAAKGAQPLPGPGTDMSSKEAREYSYTRAIQGSIARREGTPFAHCFEDEISETIFKNLPPGYQSKGGIFVPMQLREPKPPQQRAGLTTTTQYSGAELAYTQYGGELIELLRNYAAVIGMGARVMTGLTNAISFPKQSGAGTAYWMGENSGADVTESELTTAVVTVSPKTLMGLTKFSRQLLMQSVVAVEPMVRSDLAEVHALAIDRASLHGTGASNNITGIYKTSGVGAYAMGGVPTHGKLQDMITAVAVANALMRNLGWLTTPGMAGLLAQTLRSSVAGADYIWTGGYQDGTGLINGYKAIATNQVSALMSTLDVSGGTSHGCVFGNWNDLLIAMFGALELLTDPYTLAGQAMIRVTSYQACDVEVRHPASFEVATGATLT